MLKNKGTCERHLHKWSVFSDCYKYDNWSKKLKIEDMGFFKIMENIGNNPILW